MLFESWLSLCVARVIVKQSHVRYTSHQLRRISTMANRYYSCNSDVLCCSITTTTTTTTTVTITTTTTAVTIFLARLHLRHNSCTVLWNPGPCFGRQRAGTMGHIKRCKKLSSHVKQDQTQTRGTQTSCDQGAQQNFSGCWCRHTTDTIQTWADRC